jgi:hypothetical protein
MSHRRRGLADREGVRRSTIVAVIAVGVAAFVATTVVLHVRGPAGEPATGARIGCERLSPYPWVDPYEMAIEATDVDALRAKGVLFTFAVRRLNLPHLTVDRVAVYGSVGPRGVSIPLTRAQSVTWVLRTGQGDPLTVIETEPGAVGDQARLEEHARTSGTCDRSSLVDIPGHAPGWMITGSGSVSLTWLERGRTMRIDVPEGRYSASAVARLAAAL